MADPGRGLDRVPLYARASGAPRLLPHRDTIERSFGPDHDLSTVRARVGESAAVSNALLGSSAFTRGEQVEFSAEPSLDEAAHEAAHVVQQRQGARPPGGLSRAGDTWERNADAVAARVTKGEPAADLLGAPAPPVPSAANAPVQRRLIAHGSDADIARFFALVEPATGLVLSRDPATDVVTAIGSTATPATSHAFENILNTIMNDPAQDAEAQFGEHQPGVIGGAFPPGVPQTQLIDLDDMEAIEAGAPGRGVASIAHELQENFEAHTLPPGLASLPIAHRGGNFAEEAVAADLVGPGRELLEYYAPNPTGRSFIQDYENYFVVFDLVRAPPPPLTSTMTDVTIAGARHVPQTRVATFTVDNFASNSDVVPAAAATHVAAAVALLAADPTTAVHVEGFTDDMGSEGDNFDLGERRANRGRDLFPLAAANRVAAIARGETSFVVPNTSEPNRARNRRIVITVVRP